MFLGNKIGVGRNSLHTPDDCDVGSRLSAKGSRI